MSGMKPKGKPHFATRLESVVNALVADAAPSYDGVEGPVKGGANIQTPERSIPDNGGLRPEPSPHVVIRNDVGDLIGALNNGESIHVVGRAGNNAGEGMIAGEILIDGDAGEGAGTAMTGGTLVIKGDAGDYPARLLKGGTVVICGDAGYYAGLFMISGTLVILGNAGNHLGSSIAGGTIYIKGKYRSLGPNAQRARLEEGDKLMLNELVSKAQLTLDISGLKKIVAQGEPIT